MGLRQGPLVDRMLMRGKDITTLVTLLGLAWACFKGIDQMLERFKRLEATILAQNLSIVKIAKQQRDMMEEILRIRYGERRRGRRDLDPEEE